MTPVQMRKVELFVLKRDIDAALSVIGEAGCFQISGRRAGKKTVEAPEAPDQGRGQRASEPGKFALVGDGAARLSRPIENLRQLRRTLSLDYPETILPGTRLPGPAEEEALAGIAQRVAGFRELERANEDRVARVRELLDEARAFAGLDLPYKELDHLSFLAVRIGRIEAEAMGPLVAALADRALVLPVDGMGSYVAATTKKGRFALDTELSRAGFKGRVFSADFAGVPAELPAALERELAALETERADLDRRKAHIREEILGTWTALAACFAVAEAIEEVKLGLESTRLVCRLEGWVPRKRVTELAARLKTVTEGRAALSVYKPHEVELVRTGEEEVPVLLKKRAVVSSFDRLVLSYGTPIYGTVDPTPFVAFFFVLLFSIMFGDVGQGFLIFAAGLALRLALIPSLKRLKIFGPLVMGAGIGSMTMGLLTGSLFANEKWLIPLERWLTALVLGHPADRFLQLMPEAGQVGRIMTFFGVTLAIGAIVNSLGLVINISNKFKTGRLGEALFSKTGLAGAIFFWWVLGLGIRVILGGGPAWFDILGIGLPLAALVCEEPLQALVGSHHGEDEGAFAFAIKGFVAVMEAVSYFLSNSLSFLRVGAFALSHLVLSFIVFAMGDMVRASSPIGIVWEILIVILGNAIILFLEGLIVAIQVIRLQYYEFLSKFLTETGRPFVPFRFEFRKE